MQAMILAAGVGKRLGKYTRNGTKCMVEVAGRTLVERAFSALINAGIQKIILVVGHKADLLRGFIDRRYPALDVEYIENPDYESTNNIYSLWLARHKLLEDHTLLLESDVIFHDDVISRLLESNAQDMAVVSRFEMWMDGTVATLDGDDDISRIIDKSDFEWESSGEYYKTVNIYKFSREFSRNFYLPFLEAYVRSFGHNQYYEQVLTILAKTSASRIKALKIEAAIWYEIDDLHELSIAETIFADDTGRYDALTEQNGGYWRYPDVVDFREPVLPGYPPENMIKELEKIFPVLLTRRPSDWSTQDLLAANFLGIDPDSVVAAPGFNALLSSIPNHESAEIRKRAAVHLEELLSEGVSSEFIVVDESGLELLSGKNTETFLQDEILGLYKNLVVVKRISDYHGVRGLNLAVAASGNRKLISEIRATLLNSQRCSFTEYWLQIAPKYRQQYSISCQRFQETWRELKEMLQNIPGVFAEASGARHLKIKLHLVEPTSSLEISTSILSHFNLLVETSQDPERLSRDVCIRVACRSATENRRLTVALGSMLRPESSVQYPSKRGLDCGES